MQLQCKTSFQPTFPFNNILGASLCVSQCHHTFSFFTTVYGTLSHAGTIIFLSNPLKLDIGIVKVCCYSEQCCPEFIM